MMEFQVQDMSCGGCAGRITKAVKAVDADAELQIDIPTRSVKIVSAANVEKFDAAIRDAGYTPVLAG